VDIYGRITVCYVDKVAMCQRKDFGWVEGFKGGRKNLDVVRPERPCPQSAEVKY
jgi:hypothetical protein